MVMRYIFTEGSDSGRAQHGPSFCGKLSLKYINNLCKHLSHKICEQTHYPLMLRRRKKL